MSKRTWNVYAVRDGLQGGYMPSSVTYFTNKRDARAYCADTVRELRWDEYTVIGCFDTGYSYGFSDASDPSAYVLDIVMLKFKTKAERDQFIEDNQE
jgi:hypothetical protein